MADSQTNLAWETLLDLSATRSGALPHRLAEAIRIAIRGGRLPRGAALPPSRVLAGDLRVSRWTVTQAYGQLISEGFLAGRTGSATRVCWSGADAESAVSSRSVPSIASIPSVASTGSSPARFDFAQCTPDYRAFPRRKWVEAIRVVAETTPFDRLGYAEPGGEPRLRAVLAEHLNRRRAAAVDPALLTVCTGARSAMAALCRALVADGHRRIAVEDPGSSGMLDPARAAGLELVPLPVDDDGVVPESLEDFSDVRAVCVEPAHQAINGSVLAEARRRWLIAWAARVDGLVIEDDYDSEFVYEGRTPRAMQGIDPRRVALVGSMSRTMTPTVNVGWVAAPARWVAGVRTEQQMTATASALNQLALAHFIESGAYDRHLRASRQRFRKRRDALLTALAEQLPETRVRGHQAGLHVLLDLPPGVVASRIIAAAPKRGAAICDMNLMRIEGPPDEGQLMLGYGNLSDPAVAEGVRMVAELIREQQEG